MSDNERPQKLYNAIHDNGFDVKILVNNAGVGHKSEFWELLLESQLEMIRVNVEGVVKLSRLFLPDMLSKAHGRILNTASTAGFMPAPSMAVYHATKAFVLSLSEALATELKDTGVTVTALCLDATDTDFFPRAHAGESKSFQKGNVMTPQDVAEGGYRALIMGDRVYVAGGLNKALAFSSRFLTESFLAKLAQTFYADVNLDDHKSEPGDIQRQIILQK